MREVARRDKDARFTALLHHIDLNRLRVAYWAIRPQAAPGVDKVTWGAYDVDDRPTPLLNGHTATALGATAGGVLARLDHTDTTVELDHAYLNSGGVDYGYAITSHRAQGGTWDLAIGVGADGLYREAGYLALSRGRIENLLILTQTELDGFDAELARHDSPLALPGETSEDIDTELTRRLNQSRAKTLALTDDPYADLARLAERASLASLEALARNAASAEARALAIIGVKPTSLQNRIDRASQTASHVAVGQAVKPTDRNNIGIVTALDDAAGRVHVEFISAEGRTAERSVRWDDLTIIEPRHPAARVMPAVATNALGTILAEHRDGIDRWARLLAADNVAIDDAHIYGRAARLHVDRATARIVAAQPDWLTRTLGERPTAPAAAQVWDDTVRDIAAYRARHQITDRTTPLGAAPKVADQLIPWEGASTNVAEARIWLDTYSPTPTTPARARTAAELTDRRAELDAILATAPADQRHAITALTSGQLTLDDIVEILRDALAQQGTRRRWILEHWPHIVDSFEIEASLAVTPPPTIDPDELAQSPEPGQAMFDLEP